ncbi:hypothetical protein PIB30_096393, partial [Stylosanthes scabra]|nr:hypothetical protein [Stylosanthes scabra]
MESDGVASSSRRRGGSGRAKWSSSTQGAYVPRPREDRDEVSKECHYGIYII